MARTTAEALDRLHDLLVHPDFGVNAQMSTIEARDGVIMQRFTQDQIARMNLTANVADANLDSEYPLIYVFAEEAVNENRERFAWFSGTLALGIDVRLSADRPDALESSIHRYTEAAIEVLQNSEGEWSDGLMYDGRYSVRYAPTILGGDNFLQSARISLTLEQHVSF